MRGDIIRDLHTGVRFAHKSPICDKAPECMMEFTYQWHNKITDNTGAETVYCDTRADFEKLVASWNEHMPNIWEYTIP